MLPASRIARYQYSNLCLKNPPKHGDKISSVLQSHSTPMLMLYNLFLSLTLKIQLIALDLKIFIHVFIKKYAKYSTHGKWQNPSTAFHL